MTRIAILGGGISGLTAAYELELARRRGAPIDWHLYEATDRLGGIVQTTRHTTPEGDFILEGGPDAWVTEKPWATELAVELGLEDQLIYSNDATRKTYILKNDALLAIPDRMRLMVPEDLSALDTSPLFSAEAKAAYARELTRADELKSHAPTEDESIATFVRRHFGEEVLTTLAAPLLSGVFGGDVHKLSVRAVMPQFVAMEREHGSLIAPLQAKSAQRTHAPQPIFTSLRNGMASLIEALVAGLPAARLHLKTPVEDIGDENRWYVIVEEQGRLIGDHFDHVVLATTLDVGRDLLRLAGDHSLRKLLPTEASSAILVTLTWPANLARTFTLPPGFGFLIPQAEPWALNPERSLLAESEPRLLACTFVDQKFPHRAPTGAHLLRAFFGGASAETLASQPDAAIAAAALTQLRTILGPIPNPAHVEIRRLPRSLPQYEVGHLDHIAQLDALVARTPGLHLLGNSYRGLGLPDLIRDARTAARQLVTSLTTHD
jgi:oxygen-dependent protoporphyrinogen oxidase